MAEGSGNTHFNLSEDTQQGIVTKYQSLCEDLNTKIDELFKQLEELCEKTKYEPIVNFTNSVTELLTGEVSNISRQTFSEWMDGEGSFTAASENSQAGEAALETARTIEREIQDLFETFWSAPRDMIQVDTSRPEIGQEDFENLDKIYSDFAKNVEEVSESAHSGIQEEASSNPTYNLILPAISSITEAIKEFTTELSNKVNEARDESESLKQNQESKNQEAAQTAKDTAGTAKDTVEALKMFDDI